MMKKIEDLDFYEVLEVSRGATAQEIHRAYERLRKVYDPNSIALYSLFTPEETASMHRRIEEAYRTLMYDEKRKRYDAWLDGGEGAGPQEPPPAQSPVSQPAPQPPVLSADDARPSGPAEEPRQAPAPAPCQPALHAIRPAPEFTGEFTGSAIKSLREQSGCDLRTIAEITKVSIRYLEFVEEEKFEKLPARTYIRGFLVLYARALGCDAERFSGDYLRRYDAAMKPVKTK